MADNFEFDPLDGAFTAEWLMRQAIPPVEYVVPGIIPEGLTLLVAPPKIGKSWMVLGLGVAAALGSQALGCIPVSARPVLYLALEDGRGRLQRRLGTLGVQEGPDRLVLMPELVAPPLVTIGAFLERRADEKPLVILDTLGKVRGVYGGNDAYGNDYAQMSALKGLVDAVPGASLIAVHHTNKAEREDFLDSVSGTQGLAGAADSVLAIKRERNTGEARLHVTSRDAAEGEYAMTLTGGTWTLDGDGLQASSDLATVRRITSGLGDEMTRVVEYASKHPDGVRAADVVTALGISEENARKYLRRAAEADRLSNPSRGLYTPVTSVPSVPTAEVHTPFGTHGTQATPPPEPPSTTSSATPWQADTKKCPECGDPLDGRSLMARCAELHTERRTA